MMHERLQAAPAVEDPDIAQAIEDFRDQVVSVRRRSAELLKLAKDSPERAAAEARMREIVGGIALRCERIGIGVDALFVLINDDLDRRARRGRAAPERDTSRTMIKRVTEAEAAEAAAHRELTLAQEKLRAATAARLAAQEAAAALGLDQAPWWRKWA